MSPSRGEAHQVASRHILPLEVLFGVHYTFKVFVEELPGIFGGDLFDAV
jgi:hypothetical protein